MALHFAGSRESHRTGTLTIEGIQPIYRSPKFLQALKPQWSAKFAADAPQYLADNQMGTHFAQ